MILTSCAAFVVGLLFVVETSCQGLPTVPVEQGKYIGRWYQTHGNRFGWIWYGDNAVCGTATYGKIDETTISVYNHNRQYTGDGEEEGIKGVATYTGQPGKYTLQLDGVPVESTYWIIKIGPADFGPNNLYRYAVVTSASSNSLFIMARDIADFKKNDEAEVLDFVRKNGFEGYFFEPIDFPHPSNCQYPPMQ